MPRLDTGDLLTRGLAREVEDLVARREVDHVADRRRFAAALDPLRPHGRPVAQRPYELQRVLGKMAIGDRELHVALPGHVAIGVEETGEQMATLLLRRAEVFRRNVLVSEYAELPQATGERLGVAAAAAQRTP